MKEGASLEFVFDPDLHSVYVAVNTTTVPGHYCLSVIASVPNPFGGNIKKIGNIFRTDEQSGHYGTKWHDSIRFKFIEIMYLKGIHVLHEPWVRDYTLSKEAPELYLKKLSNNIDPDDAVKLAKITEHQFFSKFSEIIYLLIRRIF